MNNNVQYVIIAEPSRSKRAQRSTMGNKIGKPSIRQILVMKSAYVRLYGLSG